MSELLRRGNAPLVSWYGSQSGCRIYLNLACRGGIYLVWSCKPTFGQGIDRQISFTFSSGAEQTVVKNSLPPTLYSNRGARHWVMARQVSCRAPHWLGGPFAPGRGWSAGLDEAAPPLAVEGIVTSSFFLGHASVGSSVWHMHFWLFHTVLSRNSVEVCRPHKGFSSTDENASQTLDPPFGAHLVAQDVSMLIKLI